MADHWEPERRRIYRCQRVPRSLDLSSSEQDAGWQALPWSESFVDITGLAELAPRFDTRIRMGWDDEYLYVGAQLEEPHVWGTITEDNEVMFMDNNFEIFIDPDCDGFNYYEFEVNALGSVWELSLPKPYADGGEPRLGCNIDGLIRRTRIDGTLNDPSRRRPRLARSKLLCRGPGLPSITVTDCARPSRVRAGGSTFHAWNGGTRLSMASTYVFRRTARRW